MARAFNGTSQAITATLDLSPYTLITVAYWLWWTAYATDQKSSAGYGTNVGGTSAFYHQPNSGNGAFWEFGMTVNANQFWADRFTRPSAGAWHHFMFVHNRATPLNTAYVDGAVQSLTAVSHSGSAFGSFGTNLGLQLMRVNTTLWGAGRQCEAAIWGGVALPASAAKGLAAGAQPPTVHPANLIAYEPIWGADSPEPDYSGNRHSGTLVGAPTFIQHPDITQGLVPKRGFQPMPV